MGKGTLIDSNAVIDYLEGRLPQSGVQKIDQLLNDGKAFLSDINKIELLSFNPPDPNALRVVEQFIQRCTILAISEDIVNKTIELRKVHKSKLPDMIIAILLPEWASNKTNWVSNLEPFIN